VNKEETVVEVKIRIDDRLVRFVKGMLSRRFLLFLLAVLFSGAAVALLANPLVIPFSFKPGDVISSAQMNANFTEITNKVNAVSTQVDALTAGGSSLWVSSGTDYYYNSGNVGIGTSAPSSLLHLYSSTEDVGLRVESANVGYNPHVTLGYAGDSNVKLWRDVLSGSLKFDVNAATRMTIATSGQVEVGSGNLYVHGGHLVFDEVATGWPYEIYSFGENLYIRQDKAADQTVYLQNTYAGNVLSLDVEGDVWARGVKLTSDARLKENIRPIENALDKTAGINGVSYTLRGSDEVRLGVVAQNVQQSIPEAVSVSDESTGYLGVDYLALVPVLIEAVKELKAENEALQRRLDTLEARNP